MSWLQFGQHFLANQDSFLNKKHVQCIKKLTPGSFAALVEGKIPWQINLFSRELSALISKRSFNTTHK